MHLQVCQDILKKSISMLLRYLIYEMWGQHFNGLGNPLAYLQDFVVAYNAAMRGTFWLPSPKSLGELKGCRRFARCVTAEERWSAKNAKKSAQS